MEETSARRRPQFQAFAGRSWDVDRDLRRRLRLQLRLRQRAPPALVRGPRRSANLAIARWRTCRAKARWRACQPPSRRRVTVKPVVQSAVQSARALVACAPSLQATMPDDLLEMIAKHVVEKIVLRVRPRAQHVFEDDASERGSGASVSDSESSDSDSGSDSTDSRCDSWAPAPPPKRARAPAPPPAPTPAAALAGRTAAAMAGRAVRKRRRRR